MVCGGLHGLAIALASITSFILLKKFLLLLFRIQCIRRYVNGRDIWMTREVQLLPGRALSIKPYHLTSPLLSAPEPNCKEQDENQNKRDATAHYTNEDVGADVFASECFNLLELRLFRFSTLTLISRDEIILTGGIINNFNLSRCVVSE